MVDEKLEALTRRFRFKEGAALHDGVQKLFAMAPPGVPPLEWVQDQMGSSVMNAEVIELLMNEDGSSMSPLQEIDRIVSHWQPNPSGCCATETSVIGIGRLQGLMEVAGIPRVIRFSLDPKFIGAIHQAVKEKGGGSLTTEELQYAAQEILGKVQNSISMALAKGAWRVEIRQNEKLNLVSGLTVGHEFIRVPLGRWEINIEEIA